MKIKSMVINGVKHIKQPIELKFMNKTEKDTEQSFIKMIYGPNGSGKTGVVEVINIYKNLLTDKDYLIKNSNEIIAIMNNELGYIEITITMLYKKQDFTHYLKVELDEFGELNITKETIYKNKVLIYSNGEITQYFQMLTTKYNNNFFIDAKNPISILCAHYLLRNNKKLDGNDYVLFVMLGFKLCIVIDEKESYNYAKHTEVFHDFITLADAKSSSTINAIMDKGTTKIKIHKKDIKQYLEKEKAKTMFIKTFKPDLKKIEIEQSQSEQYVYVKHTFVYSTYKVDYEYESAGIKKLFHLFENFTNINEKILIVDELDAHLHDIAVNNLIEHVDLYTKGQLIATTHNLLTMDTIQDRPNSISILNVDGCITNWKTHGNSKARLMYKKQLIDKNIFGYTSFDFLGSLNGK